MIEGITLRWKIKYLLFFDLFFFQERNQSDHEQILAACEQDDVRKLEKLLESGANRDFEDEDGDHILCHSLKICCKYIPRWLLKQGFDVNFRSVTSKRRAIDVVADCDEDRTDDIKLLYGYGANLRTNWALDDGSSFSPLMMAMQQYQLPNMKALLDCNADPEECVNMDESTLMMSIVQRFYAGFVLLLEYGANPNCSQGLSPFFRFKHCYISTCLRQLGGLAQIQFIESLLCCGASVSCDPGLGTPFLTAIEMQSAHWAEVFIEQGCKLTFHRHNQGPTSLFGVEYFDFHRYLDMTTNVEVRDKLNKLFFGAGERIEINIKQMRKPHDILETIEAEKKEFCLMSLCRKMIRDHLRLNRINLIYQVKRLPLPWMLMNYLIYQ